MYGYIWISGFNTTNVKYMGYMFAGCKSLTSLDLSHFNTYSVTEMEYMFQGCEALRTLNLRGFNTRNVKDLGSMFDGCKHLTSLDLSSFNTSHVWSMKTMFQDCKRLETIYVGNGWSTNAVTESGDMFAGCEKLVGEQGTVYDANHVDAARARIDGGSNDPGYLTWRFYLPDGDVNGDGEVNIVDVNSIISIILGGPDIYQGRADVNGDGEVTINDINAVMTYIY